MQDQNFLTVSESAKFVGVSKMTIHRRIDTLNKSGRADIEQMLKKEKQVGTKENFKYLVNKAYLKEVFEIDDTPQVVQQEVVQSDRNDTIVIDLLKVQIDKLGIELQNKDDIMKIHFERQDRELKSKDEIIKIVLERQKETNILLANLQNTLALTAGAKEPEPTFSEPAEEIPDPQPKKKSFWRGVAENRV